MSVVSREQQVDPEDVQPAGGETQLTISHAERAILAEALQALLEDDSRRFCDIMWLGMGDRWSIVLADLSRAQYVSIVDRDSADGVRITSRGSALASDLSRPMRQSA